jgi:hypothetical protein
VVPKPGWAGCTSDADGVAVGCDDGDVCTLEGCQNSICIYFTKSCDDLNPCTTDSCDAALGCQFTVFAGCQGCAKASDCDDQDQCTTDACDTNTAQCTLTPIAGCKACNKTTEAIDCNDADACTDDLCDVLGNCYHLPKSLTEFPECKVVKCTTDQSCADNDSCTIDRCDATTGKCSHELPKCVDGLHCTKDGPAMCNNEGHPGCEVELDETCEGLTCVSSAECAFPDKCVIPKCDAGICTFNIKQCDDGNNMTLDYCDPKSGLCASTAVEAPFTNCISPSAENPNPTDCDDSDQCTIDSCFEGQCWYKIAPCTDFDPCTSDACNPDEGCVHTPIPDCKGCSIDTDCNDGNFCTTDVCGKLGAGPYQCKSVPFVAGQGEEVPEECL